MRKLRTLAAVLLMLAMTACSDNNSSSEIDLTGVAASDGTVKTGKLTSTGKSTVITLNGTSVTADSDAVEISGSQITIKDEGTYIVSGTLDDGMIIINADKEDKVEVVLNGASITSKTSAAIYVYQADKLTVTLADGSVNYLANGGSYTAIDENNIDAVIFSKDDLSLEGNGELTVKADEGHGVVSKDDLTIESGSYNVTAQKDCFQANATVTVSGGNLTIAAGDDGIHSDENVTISNGVIMITESYEGIEGLGIDISGGTIEIISEDDGLNAGGGTDSSGFEDFQGKGMFGAGNMTDTAASGSDSSIYINISGGKTYINASGDGIDSNGNLTVSGGEVYVSGPTNDGNGSFDYAGTADVTGGTVIAVGSSGMAQNFGTSSTQGSVLLSVGNQSAGTVSITDSKGNVLASYDTEKSYSCVVISCAGLNVGESYTITAGSYSETIQLDSLIYGNSGGNGGGNRGEPGAGMDKVPGGAQGGGFGGAPGGGQGNWQ